MALLDPDRLFPPEPSVSGPRARALRRGARPAGDQPARPHRSALVRRGRGRSPIRRSFSSPATTTSSACCTRRASRSTSSACRGRTGGPVETEGRRDLAAVRGELPPVPRHALAALARPRVRDAVRLRRSGCRRRPRTATTTRSRRALARAGVPAARALRAVQHRGDRHDREPARRPALARGDPRLRLGRAGAHRLPAGPGGRPGVRRGSPRTSSASASSPAATPRTWDGYLEAHRVRRAFFKALRRHRTDHGHPTARTEDLPRAEAAALFARALAGQGDAGGGRRFPRADADRDGAHEPRGRAGAADPSGLDRATTPPSAFAALRARQGLRHPDPHRLRAGAEAAARRGGRPARI